MERVVQRRSLSASNNERMWSGGKSLRPPSYGVAIADAAGPGAAMPDPLRARMEHAFASDLSGVRIHEDDRAPAIGAIAYAEGEHLHFAPGHYRPDTEAGRRTIGHELAHVVQQARGLVRPTGSVGGVPINAEPALERQADVAGARAARGEPTGMSLAGASATAGPVVQRRVVGEDLGAVLAWQEKLQAAVRERPQNYRYRYTTVGFEHEFGQMVDGPLHGVDHLELASSEAPELPFTGLPFVLETDADNAIELVSPPLLLETPPSGAFTSKSKRKPVPLAADVEKVDEMFRLALLEAVEPEKQRIAVPRPGRDGLFDYTVERTPRTLAEVAARLNGSTGIRFAFADRTVEPSQLSPATGRSFSEDTADVTDQTIEGIRVKPSTKGSVGVDTNITTQVNFATDAATADALQRESDADEDLRPTTNGTIVTTLREVEATVRGLLLPDASASIGLKIFFNALARAISGQIAVPYMAVLRAAQEEAFATGARLADLDAAELEPLKLAENLSSRVKDTSGVWVKDMVVNLGLGVLTRADWLTVHTRLSDEQLRGEIAAATAVDIFADWPVDEQAGMRDAIGDAVIAALARVVAIVEDEIQPTQARGFAARVNGLHLGLGDGETRLDFAQHDPRDIGPRQDTYIPSRKVQTPLWDRRLHVVETRGTTLADQLALIRRVGG